MYRIAGVCMLYGIQVVPGVRYAESYANMRKYSNCAGVRYMYGGLSPTSPGPISGAIRMRLSSYLACGSGAGG
jgi:hypothetical protein